MLSPATRLLLWSRREIRSKSRESGYFSQIYREIHDALFSKLHCEKFVFTNPLENHAIIVRLRLLISRERRIRSRGLFRILSDNRVDILTFGRPEERASALSPNPRITTSNATGVESDVRILSILQRLFYESSCASGRFYADARREKETLKDKLYLTSGETRLQGYLLNRCLK